MSTTIEKTERPASFLHEAMLYATDQEFVARTVDFIEEGLALGEPVLVAVPAAKVELLRPRFSATGPDEVRFAAMEEMGRNPAWIIPAWTDYARPHAAAGRPARGIGEPVWSTRTPDELVECGRHESLINLAFADIAGFTLLCPYDVSSLEPATVQEAHRNHPYVNRAGVSAANHAYRADVPALLDTPLPAVPGHARVIDFGPGSTRPIREATAQLALTAGLPPDRIQDLTVAVSEAVTNSLQHGGGSGQIAVWSERGQVTCEVRDRGRISDPLAGRVRPRPDEPGGRGLWLMTQLCDLVQIRAVPGGQAIRLHMAPDREQGRAA